MKKYLRYLLLFLFCFVPLNLVKAAGSYSVQMVSGSSSNKVIGTYDSYSSALSSMMSQKSDNNSVATIYRNGVPVDSKYALFKFKPNNMYYLYRDANSTSSYTYVSSGYFSDAALLGYSENGRVKIMVSGFIGWTDLNNGIVTPISLISGNMINVNGSGVRLRTSPSLSASTMVQISGSHNFNYTETYNADGYIWYKVNYNGSYVWIAGGSWVTKYDTSIGTYYLNYSQSGNLIHHFEVYNGVNYTDSFTNLGTSPSFLNVDQHYYSFDGNYFYENLTSMLDDYREGNYGRSVNSNNPYYSYYLYLTARSTTGYTADDLNYIVASKGYNGSNSKMYGTGAYFKEAEQQYGTNALLSFSAAINESAWGTSSLAMNKNNLFGYGAADSCPYECAYSYPSVRDSIMSYASASASNYEVLGGKYYYGSHYGNKSSGKNIMYASDPYWGEKMAMNAFLRDKGFGGKDFNSNTIGVVRKGIARARVFDSPNGSSRSDILQSNYSDPVYDMPVNIVDKVKGEGDDRNFYKVYTDRSDRNPLYGYILESDLNVSNSQPVINASDREVKLGDSFNYLEGVSSYDNENGDITSRVTYEGNVDTSKEGDYKVTYTSVDNSNFHVSKTINVKVESDFSVTGNILHYNGTSQALVQTISKYDVYYSLDKELNSNNYLEGTKDIPSLVNAGKYTVYYYCPEKNEAGSVSSEIKKVSVVNPTVKNYSGLYDGESHTISIVGGEGGVIEYSLDNKNWTTDLPYYTDLGVYTVYVRVNPDENHIASDVIESKIKIKEELDSSIEYKTHVQNFGWMDYVKDGKMSGTTGKGLRLEGIKIRLDGDYDGDIEYATHVENIGWTSFVKNDVMSGTEGMALRLEAIKIRLSGEVSEHYDVYYRVHVQNFGWLGWAKNGEYAGSAGYGYRLEGIEIKLVKKDESIDLNGSAFKDISVNYKTHVQNIGWMDYVKDGKMSGTTGKSKRLEGIKINLSSGIEGGVEYSTHVQNIGWTDFVKNDEMSGTEGKALRLEAIKIKLTGYISEVYDIYYRVHCESFGWLGWAKDGEEAGSSGFGYRLEAIEIKIVPKGESFNTGGVSYKYN